MIKTQWMNWEAKCREPTTRTSKLRNFHRDCKLSQWHLNNSLTLRSLYDVSQWAFTKHCLDLERLWPAFTRSPTQLTQICPVGWSRQVILHTVVIFILSSTICVQCVLSVRLRFHIIDKISFQLFVPQDMYWNTSRFSVFDFSCSQHSFVSSDNFQMCGRLAETFERTSLLSSH